ncbi:MAG: hypothetical protein O3A46_15630, partial [Candidatus Poribacteria bacterium]|nr:hypothetical protein [Candidatus Poribacteria bacterium]
TRPGGGFFKTPVLWLGFGVAASISAMNFLNSIYPDVPYIPVKRQDLPIGVQELNSIRVAFYPFAIGMSFLIPLDLLLSCWVFYWLYRLEIVFGEAVGMNKVPGFPFGNEQGFGAYLAILLFVMWTARGHLKNVWQIVSGQVKSAILPDKDEAMPYRVAVFGFIGAMGFLMVFALRMGMSYWAFLAFFGIYFTLGTMIARMRAELGFIVHDLHNIDPHSMLVNAFGTRRLGPKNLTAFGMFFFFNRAYRAHPAPAQLEAFKFAERAGIHPRKFVYVILMSTVVGTLITFTMLTNHYYTHGADTGHYGPWALGFARGLYGMLDGWLTFPSETDVPAVAFMGVGFGIGAAMMLIRAQFLWMPLHPLGYAMANSWGMQNLWCPLFVAWLLKFVILKQGGLGAYRKMVPFFLGLALGDYVFGYTWSMISVLVNQDLYQFWP